jgi:autotransporter translocation and assembly factor TamB
LLALAALAAAFVQSDFGKAFVLKAGTRALETVVGDVLHGRLVIGELRLESLRRGEAKNVRFFGPHGDEIARVDRVRVNLHFVKLWPFVLSLDRISGQHAHANFNWDLDLPWLKSLIAKLNEPGGPSFFSVDLRNIDIENSRAALVIDEHRIELNPLALSLDLRAHVAKFQSLEIVGRRLLFKLKREAALTWFSDKLPSGHLELLGDAGDIAYRSNGQLTHLQFKKLHPLRIVEGLGFARHDLLKWDGTVDLEATLKGEDARVSAQSQLRGLNADASGSFQRVFHADRRGRVEAHVARAQLSTLAAFLEPGQADVQSIEGDWSATVRMEGALADIGAARIVGQAKARGGIDAWVSALTPEIRTKNGNLDLDLTVAGSWAHLNWGGYLKAHAEELRLTAVEAIYQEVNLSAKGDGSRLIIESLSAKGGAGTFKASGAIDLEALEEPGALKLKGKFDNFRILSALPTIRIPVSLTGSLDLGARLSRSSIGDLVVFDGKLDVAEGKAIIPDDRGKKDVESLSALEDVVMPQPVPPVGHLSGVRKEGDGGASGFGGFRGGIDIDVPGKFVVESQSKDMLIELGAKLEAGLKEKQELFVKGEVTARHGFAELFGRHFDLRQGSAVFHGNITTPRIDAEAIYKASPYSIVVSLKGGTREATAVTDIRPKFTSEPPGLSEDQALGVLLTGSENYRSTSTASTSTSEAATNAVTGAATGYIVGQLRKELGSALPIDTLTAGLSTDTQSASGEEAGTRAKIEVGKYLTDQIFLRLGHDYDPLLNESFNKLSLSYRLSERWSLETTQTDLGRSDIGVQWTHNY